MGDIFLNFDNTELKRPSKIFFSVPERRRWAVLCKGMVISKEARSQNLTFSQTRLHMPWYSRHKRMTAGVFCFSIYVCRSGLDTKQTICWYLFNFPFGRWHHQ